MAIRHFRIQAMCRYGKGFRPGLILLLLLLAGMRVGAALEPRPPAAELERLVERYEQMQERLDNRRYAALVNYRQPSWEPRFYLVDLQQQRVVESYHVAHGKGSDPEHDGFASAFSDRHGSHMSSVGFFLTGETYVSEQAGHGLSLRLKGLSPSNRNAFDRNIVIHANHYMENDFIDRFGKPGRSHGCFTLKSDDRDEVIARLRGGALIYAIH
ncbi:hypothetical protein J2T55_001941 [Methylohalomonas lacus]|uniref:Murein L,D-transpeptidase catalytic domain family protein n=1 Tax=Methylohalomonas lacus TaxID=398773 RepID=A0AAE3L1E7_9GAMM|nr:murein L,D-transpeptidase catalytic domain family protein [Methylohalomonas lacus]MCS3903909.1 hypothetical protein [Methylohalomonas lacus]